MAKKTEVMQAPDATVAAYLAMPYTRMLVPDAEEGGFIAEVLELPGCITEGETPEEAYRNLDDAMGGIIAVLLEGGRAVPAPIGLKEYSGRFPLRMSTELHREAATRAQAEGISLNQWIAQSMANTLAAKTLADEVVERLSTIRVVAGVQVEFGEVTAPIGSPESITRLPPDAQIRDATRKD